MDKYSITLPVSSDYFSPEEILYVEKDSAMELREKLEIFALYFKYEFKYDWVQYEANEHLHFDNKYTGFLFSEKAWDKVTEDDPTLYRLSGGGCFRW